MKFVDDKLRLALTANDAVTGGSTGISESFRLFQKNIKDYLDSVAK